VSNTLQTGRAPADLPARAPARHHRGRLMATAVVAVLIGLALGRFVFADAAGAPSIARPGPQTPQARIAALEAAVEANPQDLPSWQALGGAYTDRAIYSSDPTFYNLADRALDRAAELEPGNLSTMLGRANLSLSLHDFRAARRLGGRIVAEDPFSAEAHGVLVDAEVELGHYRAATRRLEQMLEVDPGLPALSRTSYLRELHGDLDGAVLALQQADVAGASRGPAAAAALTLLGDVLRKRGDDGAAEAAYQRALRIYPELIAAEVGIARLLASDGNRPRAIKVLTALTERLPQPAALTLLGELLALEGREAEAADAFALVEATAALQRDAGQDTDLEMALFAADHGDGPAAAVRLGRRAWRARPDNIYAADALAWALHRAGRDTEALPLMRRALRLGTSDALLRYHAAEVFAGAGRDQQARQQLREARDTDPWFSPHHQPSAGALARQLGLRVPPAWTRP